MAPSKNVATSAIIDGRYHRHGMRTRGQRQRFTFLDLPAEIRNEVYSLVLPSDPLEVQLCSTQTFPMKLHGNRKNTLAIAHTCRQIRAESMALYFSNNTFAVEFDSLDQNESRPTFDWLQLRVGTFMPALQYLVYYEYLDLPTEKIPRPPLRMRVLYQLRALYECVRSGSDSTVDLEIFLRPIRGSIDAGWMVEFDRAVVKLINVARRVRRNKKLTEFSIREFDKWQDDLTNGLYERLGAWIFRPLDKKVQEV